MSKHWDPDSGQQPYPPTQQVPQQSAGSPPRGGTGGPYGRPPKKNNWLVLSLLMALIAIAIGVTVFLLINTKDTAGPPAPKTQQPTASSMSPQPSSPQEDVTKDAGRTQQSTDISMSPEPSDPETSDLGLPSEGSGEVEVPTYPADSDEAQIQQASQGMMDAFGSGNAGDMVKYICSDKAENIPEDFEDLYSELGFTDRILVAVTDIKISGDTATAMVTMSADGKTLDESDAEFRKENGIWKVCE